MKSLLLILCFVAAAALPGCIVGEIRDELQGVNDNLGTVQTSLEKLDETNERILKTNESISRTNLLIDEVEKGLGRIDNTNASLGEVDKRLMLLASIDKSLTRLDTHLASLRGTISKLDNVIPFLDLGGDAPPEAEPATTGEATAPETATTPTEGTAPVAETAAPATGEAAPRTGDAAPIQPVPDEAAPATPTAKKTSEPLSGTWLIRHPKDGGLLVLLPGNKYILVELTSESRGEWKREGNKIVLTHQFPESYRRKSDAPPPKPEESKLQPKDNPNYERASRTIEIEIITSSPRNATVRMDGVITVLVRPS